MSPTTTYPIRYFSIVTVPKEFTHQMSQIENTALSGGASLNHDEIEYHANVNHRACNASTTNES